MVKFVQQASLRPFSVQGVGMCIETSRCTSVRVQIRPRLPNAMGLSPRIVLHGVCQCGLGIHQ